MRDNVFLENKKELELADFMNYADGSRGNLGKDIPKIKEIAYKCCYF